MIGRPGVMAAKLIEPSRLGRTACERVHVHAPMERLVYHNPVAHLVCVGQLMETWRGGADYLSIYLRISRPRGVTGGGRRRSLSGDGIAPSADGKDLVKRYD